MKEWLVIASEHVIVIVDMMALAVIVYGSVEAFIQGMRLVLWRPPALESRQVWLRFSRLLVAALTFQLGADIIETAISATRKSLVRIAVIAVIRTFLNYFLEKDVRELRTVKEA